MTPVAGVVSATAPLDRALAVATEQCFATRLREIYGCTEAGSMATRASTQTDAWQLLEGFTLTESEQGVIARATHLADAALLQDQLHLHDPQSFSLLGRNADMINVAGKRASLADLSLKLLAIEGVRDGVFFLPERDAANQRPAALVVSDLPEKHILQQLALQMDAAYLPRPLRKVAQLPRNETGKLTYAALQTLWNQIHPCSPLFLPAVVLRPLVIRRVCQAFPGRSAGTGRSVAAVHDRAATAATARGAADQTIQVPQRRAP